MANKKARSAASISASKAAALKAAALKEAASIRSRTQTTQEGGGGGRATNNNTSAGGGGTMAYKIIIDDLYNRAKVDPKVENVVNFFNKCVYACKICGSDVNFTSDFEFKTHVVKKHGITLASYTEKYGIHAIKYSKFECGVCKLECLRDLDKVVPHLHGEHKLSPIEYYQKFANTQKGGGPEIIDIESEGDDSEGEETAVAPPPTLLDHGKSLLFDDWSNQCEIECKICQESFTKTGFDALALHLRVKHMLTADAYKEKFKGAIINKIKKHRCRVCNEFVTQQKNVLDNHMREKHVGLRLEKYFLDHIYEKMDKSKLQRLMPNPPPPPPTKPGNNTPQSQSLSANITPLTANNAPMMRQIPPANITPQRQNTPSNNTPQRQTPKPPETPPPAQTMEPEEEEDDFEDSPPIKKRKVIASKRKKTVTTTTPKAGAAATPPVVPSIKKTPVQQPSKLAKAQAKNVSTDEEEVQVDSASISIEVIDDLSAKLDRIMSRISGALQEIGDKKSMAEDVKLNSPPTPTEALRRRNSERFSFVKTGPVTQFQVDGEVRDSFAFFNGCVYTCVMCAYSNDKLYYSETAVARHIKAEHNLSLEEFKAKHGTPLAKKAFLKCALCDEKILRERSKIGKHLALVHDGMTLDTYFDKNGESEEQRKGDEYILRPIKSVTVMAEELKAKMDLCVYGCGVCSNEGESFETKNRAHFEDHLTRSHKIESYQSYLKANGNPIKSKNYFRCSMCGSTILHDSQDITAHLTAKHSVRPENFFKNKTIINHNNNTSKGGTNNKSVNNNSKVGNNVKETEAKPQKKMPPRKPAARNQRNRQ